MRCSKGCACGSRQCSSDPAGYRGLWTRTQRRGNIETKLNYETGTLSSSLEKSKGCRAFSDILHLGRSALNLHVQGRNDLCTSRHGQKGVVTGHLTE